MNQAIVAYDLDGGGTSSYGKEQTITTPLPLPEGTVILEVGELDSHPVLWALTDLECEIRVNRWFIMTSAPLYGAAREFKMKNPRYIGSHTFKPDTYIAGFMDSQTMFVFEIDY